MTDNAPKSALDLVLERLKKKDAEAGVQETTLTEAQRAEIAEVRRTFDARVAERKIMHQSQTPGAVDPAEGEERNAELRRDLDRFERERDEKIRRIRGDRP